MSVHSSVVSVKGSQLMSRSNSQGSIERRATWKDSASQVEYIICKICLHSSPSKISCYSDSAGM